MAETHRISPGKPPAADNPEPPADQDAAYLKKLCSRLAGDTLCRCGGNLNGRYCLWSYYRIQPGPGGDLPPAGPQGPDK
ncbi:MAG: hypothetical protein P4N41_12000 [Negativicutes bacterium]|nr:hypothetical protein [Negativicutes bacterium]